MRKSLECPGGGGVRRRGMGGDGGRGRPRAATTPSSGWRTCRARRPWPGLGSTTRRRPRSWRLGPSTSPSTRGRSRSSTRRRRSRRPSSSARRSTTSGETTQHERGIWRRTTLASYRTAAPQWETVLDVDALAKTDGKAWVFHGADCLAAGVRAVHGQPLARWLRRIGAARVRHEDEGIRVRRLLPAGGQVDASPGTTRTRSGSARTSAPAR